MTRLTNSRARYAVNAWLYSLGHERLSDSLSYSDFASQLRATVSPGVAADPFASREDAVAFVRSFAKTHVVLA